MNADGTIDYFHIMPDTPIDDKLFSLTYQT